MQEIFEKIIEKLEALNIENQSCSKCVYREECDAMQEKNDIADDVCLCTMLMKLKAIEIVKQTAEKYNNGWIPVSERLPTTEEYQRGNGRFLVTDGNRTYEAEFDIYESHIFGKSRMATEWFVTDKCVTHWQNESLPPEQYQPKGE